MHKNPPKFVFLGVLLVFTLNMYFLPIMFILIQSAKCYTDRISHNNNVIIYSTFIKNIHNSY